MNPAYTRLNDHRMTCTIHYGDARNWLETLPDHSVDALITDPPYSSGGLILDPFAGSGTTLVAAALEGYRAIGCELSEHYYHVARERLAALIPFSEQHAHDTAIEKASLNI